MESKDSDSRNECDYRKYHSIQPHEYPLFQNYQLVGDSQFVRFSELFLNSKRQYFQNSSGRVGYCVGGQTAQQLVQNLERKAWPVYKNVILLIGTNDISQNTDPSLWNESVVRIIALFRQYRVSNVLLLTVPPVPKFWHTVQHWMLFVEYNEILKDLEKKYKDSFRSFQLLDISSIFFIKSSHPTSFYSAWLDLYVASPVPEGSEPYDEDFMMSSNSRNRTRGSKDNSYLKENISLFDTMNMKYKLMTCVHGQTNDQDAAINKDRFELIGVTLTDVRNIKSKLLAANNEEYLYTLRHAFQKFLAHLKRERSEEKHEPHYVCSYRDLSDDSYLSSKISRPESYNAPDGDDLETSGVLCRSLDATDTSRAFWSPLPSVATSTVTRPPVIATSCTTVTRQPIVASTGGLEKESTDFSSKVSSTIATTSQSMFASGPTNAARLSIPLPPIAPPVGTPTIQPPTGFSPTSAFLAANSVVASSTPVPTIPPFTIKSEISLKRSPLADLSPVSCRLKRRGSKDNVWIELSHEAPSETATPNLSKDIAGGRTHVSLDPNSMEISVTVDNKMPETTKGMPRRAVSLPMIPRQVMLKQKPVTNPPVQLSSMDPDDNVPPPTNPSPDSRVPTSYQESNVNSHVVEANRKEANVSKKRSYEADRETTDASSEILEFGAPPDRKSRCESVTRNVDSTGSSFDESKQRCSFDRNDEQVSSSNLDEADVLTIDYLTQDEKRDLENRLNQRAVKRDLREKFARKSSGDPRQKRYDRSFMDRVNTIQFYQFVQAASRYQSSHDLTPLQEKTFYVHLRNMRATEGDLEAKFHFSMLGRYEFYKFMKYISLDYIVPKMFPSRFKKVMFTSLVDGNSKMEKYVARNLDISMFETHFSRLSSTPRNKSPRVDLVHLNQKGFELLKECLSQAIKETEVKEPRL